MSDEERLDVVIVEKGNAGLLKVVLGSNGKPLTNGPVPKDEVETELTVAVMCAMALDECESNKTVSMSQLINRGMLANALRESSEKKKLMELNTKEISLLSKCIHERWKHPTIACQLIAVVDPTMYKRTDIEV